MRKLKIVILEEAMVDLEEIWFYTFATWSQEQADRYHSLITKEIEFLATKPESGKILEHLRKGYRSCKVKSHYIFYRFRRCSNIFPDSGFVAKNSISLVINE